MKKFAAVLLVCLMLLPLTVFTVAAEDPAPAEPTNIAPEGLAYSSSEKNSLWTPPRSINDGVMDWHGWEPLYPTVASATGFSGEYCGIRFTDHKYFAISEIHMNIGLHALYGENDEGQDMEYVIEFLIEGEWIHVATLYDHEATVTDSKYSSYEQAMREDTSAYHIGATLSYTLPEAITTNNVRVTVNNFGVGFPGGDVLVFPYIYELELIGVPGEIPALELPEGAVASHNAARLSLPGMTSSAQFHYAYLAIDGKDETYWSPATANVGEAIELRLADTFSVTGVSVLSLTDTAKKNRAMDYAIEAYCDGEWKLLATCPAINGDGEYLAEYTGDAVSTDRIRIRVAANESGLAPMIAEISVTVEEKTYAIDNRYNARQIASAAKGNLAILGTPYASENMLPYSDPLYLTDGDNAATAKNWFIGEIKAPVTIGVKLDDVHEVRKVVVYCEPSSNVGHDTIIFRIDAKQGDAWKTLSDNCRSYDPATGYMTIWEFDSVSTDEIRIVIERVENTFPAAQEIEIYGEGVLDAFSGAMSIEKEPNKPAKTSRAYVTENGSFAAKEETPSVTIENPTALSRILAFFERVADAIRDAVRLIF